MNGGQNLELQLVALQHLKKELDSLVQDIESRGKSYVTCVQGLMRQDLDVNVARQYKEQYWQYNNGMMAQLRQRIMTYDIPYIERCIVAAQAALEKFKEK
jgi:hypothetical protein